MKKFWVRLNEWNKNIATAALEQGADAILLPKGLTPKVKELGVIATIAEDSPDLKLGKDVVELEINSKGDEERAAKLASSKMVIVKTTDWSIIPLENLVAQTDSIIAEVRNCQEAKTALEVLEKGVSGILLNSTSVQEIIDCAKLVKGQAEKLQLSKIEISSLRALGSGDRVCVDTCSNMGLGQGMLVGNSSSGFFLVHSESIDNPYVEQRPFRVNAGAVHAYVKNADGKTNYLSDLKSGNSILLVDAKGSTEIAVVGRLKIERRPLMLVEGTSNGSNVSLVLQNAETIRLVKPDGKPVSVVKLKRGDEVLGFTEDAGRHFGLKVKEKITEK
ncbi:MAG: 3-dehydroquinate synthase II [Candidatus Diapherotrites archaeon]|uniref:3-dehydroquinate synthase n=1 Tax=Candidatus Iainarchaeum sp. TaxID=3101447 RepID=A0A938YVM8_9ARCH|nr:3-dehydroquinate synthase II [Candidatus Diapherotrites archaeon]